MSARHSNDLLRQLGRRVRRQRRERGWTRERLAERSGLSVRFLARIESGDGNLSLLRLAALAEALETSPDALIRPDGNGVLALVGLRGAGKSTVGPLLATRLGVPFTEIDDLIREAAGLPLDQIFELHGERYYRRLERETLRRILAAGRPCVVATAGGIVNEPESWNLLKEQSMVVWLRAHPEDHWNRVVSQGDRRPMTDHPDAMDELRRLLDDREPRYREAHLSIDTHEIPPDAIVRRITSGLSR